MLTVAAAIVLAASAPASVLDKTLVCSTERGDVDVLASPRGDGAYATARTGIWG